MLMKKYSLLVFLVAFVSVAAFGQKSKRAIQPTPFSKIEMTAKPAVKTLTGTPMQPGSKLKAITDELVTLPAGVDPEVWTISGSFQLGTSSGWSARSINKATNVAIDGNDVYIQGLAYWFPDGYVKGTLDGTTITVESGQLIGEDEYGPEYMVGTADGSTISDYTFTYNADAGTITLDNFLIIESGDAESISAYGYWTSVTLTSSAAPEPEAVVPPAGLVTEEYSIVARNYDNDEDVSGSVNIGFDGSDVYIQGLCSYIPDAWVKGTISGSTVTFPSGQYFGNYGGAYDMFLNTLQGANVVFTYDGTDFTAQNAVFLVDNDSYYFDSYRNAVFKKVVEKAAMPANPSITSLSNGSYGYYIKFNVPTVDVDGDGLATSKLSYKFYTDIERVIEPLTFTPETHIYLTENMTEIPYGFTEDYDFFDGTVYLNELYSSDWNRIGIQSIYTGDDVRNETEIQWFAIKDYAPTVVLPVIAPDGGVVDAGTVVTVTVPASDAWSLIVTTDGSDPAELDEGAEVYDSETNADLVDRRGNLVVPITIEETTTVRAITINNTTDEISEEASATFTVLAPLPVPTITAADNSLYIYDEEEGKVYIQDEATLSLYIAGPTATYNTYYTRDGSDPTTSSTRLTPNDMNMYINMFHFAGRPVNINPGEGPIKAACYDAENDRWSEIAVWNYVVTSGKPGDDNTPAETVEIVIGDTGFATLYYSDKNIQIPSRTAGASVRAYTITYDGEKISEGDVFVAGDVIPANTAVVLENYFPEAITFDAEVVEEVDNSEAEGISGAVNYLRGFDTDGLTRADTDGDFYFYKLSDSPKGVGFFWAEDNGAPFLSAANKAYLVLPASASSVRAFYFSGDTEVTGISSLRLEKSIEGTTYDLQGRRVQNAGKGVFIVNGKKVIK